MVKNKKPKYILHVSDFHLNSENLDFAESGLNFLSETLDNNDITIDYLIHTGDVIDANNAYMITAEALAESDPEFAWIKKECITESRFDEKKFKNDTRTTNQVLDQFNEQLLRKTQMLFSSSLSVIKGFLSDIRVRKRQTYFCIGNHDGLRPIIKDAPEVCQRFKTDDGDAEDFQKKMFEYEEKYKIFQPYTGSSSSFLEQLGVWSTGTHACSNQTTDINLVVLNTNHRNPNGSKEGYYCVDCLGATKVLNEFNKKQDSSRLNIVIAHKPIYEICEAARMSFSSYHKTEFMAAMQSFLGENGIYICGDKHTRSVSDTTFHSIQHIIGGAPFPRSNNTHDFHVEYNLIEMVGNKVGNVQKIHLSYNKREDQWSCVFRPEDTLVETLYDLSSSSVIPQCLSVLTLDCKQKTWMDISRIFYRKNSNPPKWEILEQKLDELYHVICKYVKRLPDTNSDISVLEKWDSNLSENSIFECMRDYLAEKMTDSLSFDQNNILNIRGEYSSGKSTFLGILYIYLLYQYSIGQINFIPAYFNLENKGLLNQINSEVENVRYYDAATNSFKIFVKEIQQIADTSHQAVCYLIDGLDEQDVWSYSSEDSVGRGILDILDGAKNSKNIMSYSQHHLPLFKNTMPERKYKDYSDVMYFNNVHIVSADRNKEHFRQFISTFYSLQNERLDGRIHSDTKDEQICKLIRKFCRLSVSQNFLYKFGDYITEKTESPTKLDMLSIDEVYKNYIDLLHKMCMETLGYGYVHYAPAMAHLFSFKGFTYERFRQIPPNVEDYWQSRIAAHSDKVYRAFIFIKKNQDVREYLLAMHYNRELRFYAENPEQSISDSSILNEFIPRNTAILSRKMWKRDPNRFVIVCVDLLEKRREMGQKPISNCALSMLIYTLTHQEKMYAPSIKMLDRIIAAYDTVTGKISDAPENGFSYKQQELDCLQLFLDYSLHRTYKLYKAVQEGNSENLVLAMKEDPEFALYNRQYLRLYYGDLTISGENRKAALIPGKDVCLKGFDFHNTFNFLSEKLCSIENQPYALMAFDLYSLCDLIDNRLCDAASNNQNTTTFFAGKKNVDTQIGVLRAAVGFIDVYLAIATNSANEETKRVFNRFKEEFISAITDRLPTA